MRKLHLLATLTSMLILATLLWCYTWTNSAHPVQWVQAKMPCSRSLERNHRETKSLLTFESSNQSAEFIENPTQGARVLLLAYPRQVWIFLGS